MNGPLSLYASPVDFSKNDKLENKINEIKKNKLNLDMLNKFKKEKEDEKTISSIHENIKVENDNTLADFYDSELKQTLEKEKAMKEYVQDNYITDDYLIKNNERLNIVARDRKPQISMMGQDDVLTKLNYIIDLFEDQKEIRTSQKNEEIVLYCFLGIFMIYVLDSFVSVGKYSRA
jgi:hypothetical protein